MVVGMPTTCAGPVAHLLTSLVLTLLPLGLAAEGVPAAERLPNFNDPAATLKNLEQTMNSYFRHNRVNELVDGFNDWQAKANAELKTESAKLEAQYSKLKELEKQLEESERKLKAKPKPAHYDQLVDQHNQKVEEQRKLAKEYQASSKAFEARRAELDRQAKQQSGGINKTITSYSEWYKKGEDLTFNRTLNQLYAFLRIAERNSKAPERLKEPLQKLSRIRQELREWAIKQNQESKGGMLFVTVTLCGKEEGSYIVDTGCGSTTLSFSMVYLLGLENSLGEEVIINLAGGQRITGRRLVLPSVTVQGQTLKDVDATALPDDHVGVDGLLGHSFLDRFNYIIDSAQKPPLTLKPLPKP